MADSNPTSAQDGFTCPTRTVGSRRVVRGGDKVIGLVKFTYMHIKQGTSVIWSFYRCMLAVQGYLEETMSLRPLAIEKYLLYTGSLDNVLQRN